MNKYVRMFLAVVGSSLVMWRLVSVAPANSAANFATWLGLWVGCLVLLAAGYRPSRWWWIRGLATSLGGVAVVTTLGLLVRLNYELHPEVAGLFFIAAIASFIGGISWTIIGYSRR